MYGWTERARHQCPGLLALVSVLACSCPPPNFNTILCCLQELAGQSVEALVDAEGAVVAGHGHGGSGASAPSVSAGKLQVGVAYVAYA